MSFTPPSDESFALRGGLDQIHPPIMMKPGALMMGFNVEMIAGVDGYRRHGGYEVVNGLPLPSNATITLVTLDAGGAGTIILGDEFLNGSGVKAYPLHHSDPVEDSLLSLYVPGDTPAAPGDTFTSGGNSFIVSTVTESLAALSGEDRANHYIAAVETARSHVDPVPGSGTMRGVVYFEGTIYAFRDNAAGTACDMYASSSAGWVQVAMPDVIYFSEGKNSVDNSTGFQAGQTVTNGSGGSATIMASTRWGGVWDSGQPAVEQSTGYLALSSITGSFAAGNTLTSGDVTAKADSANQTVSLNPGGSYKFKIYNFYADVDKNAIYGVDGKNYAFEFDGTTYIPIIPEHHQDLWPTHILDHQERLYLAYPGGDWIYSATVLDDGSVRVFNPVFDAGDWNTGQEIVATEAVTGGAVAVMCEESIWILTGDAGTWSFKKFKSTVGAIAGSVGGDSDLVFLNGSTLTMLSATSAYGDFMPSPIVPQVQPFLRLREGKVSCTTICKAKSQYRLFFTDGSSLYVAFDGNKAKGAIPGKLPVPVRCVWSSMDNGIEHMYFGSDDGFIYKMDSGDTFNEWAITGSFRLPFYHYGSPRNWKHFLRLAMEMESPVLLTGNTKIAYTLNFSYGNPEIPRGTTSEVEILGGGGFYDADYTYGSFIYSGQAITELVDHVDGVGANMSILINFEARYDKAFMFHACLVDYIKMGVVQ